MLNTDESAFICDLAETYHIFDYKSLPLSRVAIFAIGLRENSRIKMKMNGEKYPIDTMLLANIADSLSLATWLKTKDAINGENRPKSIVASLLQIEEAESKSNSKVEVFETPEDFEKRWKEIIGKGGK